MRLIVHELEVELHYLEDLVIAAGDGSHRRRYIADRRCWLSLTMYPDSRTGQISLNALLTCSVASPGIAPSFTIPALQARCGRSHQRGLQMVSGNVDQLDSAMFDSRAWQLWSLVC